MNAVQCVAAWESSATGSGVWARVCGRLSIGWKDQLLQPREALADRLDLLLERVEVAHDLGVLGGWCGRLRAMGGDALVYALQVVRGPAERGGDRGEGTGVPSTRGGVVLQLADRRDGDTG